MHFPTCLRLRLLLASDTVASDHVVRVVAAFSGACPVPGRQGRGVSAVLPTQSWFCVSRPRAHFPTSVPTAERV